MRNAFLGRLIASIAAASGVAGLAPCAAQEIGPHSVAPELRLAAARPAKTRSAAGARHYRKVHATVRPVRRHARRHLYFRLCHREYARFSARRYRARTTRILTREPALQRQSDVRLTPSAISRSVTTRRAATPVPRKEKSRYGITASDACPIRFEQLLLFLAAGFRQRAQPDRSR
jgi:hypothetical protein